MAVEEPRPGVIRQEGQNEIPLSRQHGDIPARRVIVIQCRGIREEAHACSEDVEVVPVEVDGVWCPWRRATSYFLNNPKGPRVAVGELDDIEGLGVGVIALDHVLEGGFVPCHDHGCKVQVPLDVCLVIGVLDDG